ncbi:MAG: hypothetical protein AAGH41_00855 [Pseudomonadota bacterium]
MRNAVFAATALFGTGLAASAQASITQTTTLADFEAAVGATSVVTFAQSTLNTTAPSVSGNLTLDSGPGTSGYAIGEWSANIAGDTDLIISGPENWQLDFAVPVNAFALVISEPSTNTGLAVDSCNAQCIESTFLFEFFDGASLVGSAEVSPADDTGVFAGFVASAVFNRLVVTETIGGIDNELFGEFRFAGPAVPIPAAFPLFAAAAAGFGAWRRRSRLG